MPGDPGTIPTWRNFWGKGVLRTVCAALFTPLFVEAPWLQCSNALEASTGLATRLLAFPPSPAQPFFSGAFRNIGHLTGRAAWRETLPGTYEYAYRDEAHTMPEPLTF